MELVEAWAAVPEPRHSQQYCHGDDEERLAPQLRLQPPQHEREREKLRQVEEAHVHRQLGAAGVQLPQPAPREVHLAAGEIEREQRRKRRRDQQVAPAQERAEAVLEKQHAGEGQQPDAQQRRPEQAAGKHDAARRQEARLVAKPQHQQRRQPAADEVLGRDREDVDVGEILQEQRACRRPQGCEIADAVGVVGHPLGARRRADERQAINAELFDQAPHHSRQAVAQHMLQHVHAAEEHEHDRRQQHRPSCRQALGCKRHDQGEAAPGPQRHRPVQRIDAQPLGNQPRHDEIAQVVAQQRRFVARIVGQVGWPVAARQVEEHGAVRHPVGFRGIDQPAGREQHHAAQGQRQRDHR